MKYFEEVFCRKLRDMFDQHNPAPSHKLHYNLYTRSTVMTMMMTMRMRKKKEIICTYIGDQKMNVCTGLLRE